MGKRKKKIGVGGPACAECVGVGGLFHTQGKVSALGKTLKNPVLDPALIWIPAVSYNVAPRINGIVLAGWAYFPGGDKALVYAPNNTSAWRHVWSTANTGPTGLMIGYKNELPIAVGGPGHEKHIDVQSIQFAIDKARARLSREAWFVQRQQRKAATMTAIALAESGGSKSTFRVQVKSHSGY